jgi:Fe-S-cluster-containing dehydrogenase component
MKIDRRNFFRVVGVTGASIALSEKLSAATENEAIEDSYGILIDSFMCGGCQSCEFACAEAHGLAEPEDEPQLGLSRRTDETRRTVVNAFDTSEGEVTVKNQCMHCIDPACVSACLTKAMYKTKEGAVVWREDKCMGCRYCMISCPFDVPKFEYNSPNPRIIKCDMCHDRVKEGKIPACAEICPSDAIVFGKRSELIKEARKRIFEYPDYYRDYVYGETEAGGTGVIYIGQVPFKEIGFKTGLEKDSYPSLSKGFLYSVPFVFVLWPTMLLGIYEATKNNRTENLDENE